jgi:hypothetical protein
MQVGDLVEFSEGAGWLKELEGRSALLSQSGQSRSLGNSSGMSGTASSAGCWKRASPFALMTLDTWSATA